MVVVLPVSSFAMHGGSSCEFIHELSHVSLSVWPVGYSLELRLQTLQGGQGPLSGQQKMSLLQLTVIGED